MLCKLVLSGVVWRGIGRENGRNGLSSALIQLTICAQDDAGTTHIDVAHNNLTGTVPSEIGEARAPDVILDGF